MALYKTEAKEAAEPQLLGLRTSRYDHARRIPVVLCQKKSMQRTRERVSFKEAFPTAG